MCYKRLFLNNYFNTLCSVYLIKGCQKASLKAIDSKQTKLLNIYIMNINGLNK